MAGIAPKVGGTSPLPSGRTPGGWTPPGVNDGRAPPGTNRITGARPPIDGPQEFANRKDIPFEDVRRGVNDLAGGSAGLSAAEDAVNRRDFAPEASSAADAAKELYDREYAKDLLTRWPWGSFWGGGGYSSGGGDGTSSSGYSNGYSNPYSTEAAAGYGSTAEAAPQEQNSAAQTAAPSNEVAANTDNETTSLKQCMDVALRAFQNGDYPQAQKQCEQAIELAKSDADLHEFRALCQFAQGDYKDAAATLYPVLAAGPGWNWNTLSSLYANAEVYTKQLRMLEQYVKDNPRDASGCFVLAYHYLVLDERDAALNQLHQVAKLQPQDNVSSRIVQALEKANKNNAGQAAGKPAPAR